MHIQFSEYLRCIQEVLVFENLFAIEYQERQVQNQGKPIAIDKEQERQEGVDGSFWDNVGVEAVAKVDRIDVVTFQVAVHDCEEDLEEQVDGIYEDSEQV